MGRTNGPNRWPSTYGHNESSLQGLTLKMVDDENVINDSDFSKTMNFKRSDDQLSLASEDQFNSIVNKLIELDRIDQQRSQMQNNIFTLGKGRKNNGIFKLSALNSQDQHRLRVSI